MSQNAKFAPRWFNLPAKRYSQALLIKRLKWSFWDQAEHISQKLREFNCVARPTLKSFFQNTVGFDPLPFQQTEISA